MVFKWNREQIEKFIICVEQHSCIYNIKSLEYMDRNKKAQAFNSILVEMQKVEGSITLEEIKRKWKNLGTQYMHELRTANQSKKSGSGREDLYVPKLWCFQQLNFLKSHSEGRKRIDNTEVTTPDKENVAPSPHTEEVLSEEPPTKIQKVTTPDKENATSTYYTEQYLSKEPLKKPRKCSSAVKGIRNDLDNLKTVISQRKSEKKYAWLGNLVTNQMETICSEDQPDAAWQVQCLMRRLTSQSAQKQRSLSASSSNKDILQLSMDGIFDDDDFN